MIAIIAILITRSRNGCSARVTSSRSAGLHDSPDLPGVPVQGNGLHLVFAALERLHPFRTSTRRAVQTVQHGLGFHLTTTALATSQPTTVTFQQPAEPQPADRQHHPTLLPNCGDQEPGRQQDQDLPVPLLPEPGRHCTPAHRPLAPEAGRSSGPYIGNSWSFSVCDYQPPSGIPGSAAPVTGINVDYEEGVLNDNYSVSPWT